MVGRKLRTVYLMSNFSTKTMLLERFGIGRTYCRVRDDKREILLHPIVGTQVPFATVMWLPKREHVLSTEVNGESYG